MDLGNERVDATDGQERQETELLRQFDEHRGNHRAIRSRVAQAIATASGARTSNATRAMAIATKPSNPMATCHGVPSRGRAILRPVAMTRPVAVFLTIPRPP